MTVMVGEGGGRSPNLKKFGEVQKLLVKNRRKLKRE